MPIDLQRVQAVFQAVAELSPAERGAALERECGGDAELRRHVEALLKAHDDSGELPAAEAELTAGTALAVHRPGGYTPARLHYLRGPGSLMSEVTRILSAIEEGDTHAAERLLPLKNAAARPSDSPSTLPKRPLPRATNNSFDNDALNDFARADPQAAALVKLRFFAGMTMTEAADALSMSVRSAHDLFNTPATSVPPTKARHRRPSEKRPRG